MTKNERMLELAGLGMVLSGAKLTLVCAEQLPQKIRANTRCDLESTIEYLRQALEGLRNRQTWANQRKFALSSDYIQQDEAYVTLSSVLEVPDTEADQCLADHIGTLTGALAGSPLEERDRRSTSEFLARANQLVQARVLREQEKEEVLAVYSSGAIG